MRVRPFLGLAVVFLLGAAMSIDDDADKELKKMEGTWIMSVGEQDGQEVAADTIKTAKLTIKGDKHTVRIGADTLIGTHMLDPTKSPKHIDATDTEGPHKGQTLLGIYSLTDDELKVCFAPEGKDRPKDFTTKSGTGTIYHVWKRQQE